MKKFAKFFMAMVMISSLAIAGCGDAKKKEENKDTKTKENASAPADSDVATKDPVADGKLTTVNLKLPNMTWGGCVPQVREALTSVSEFSDIKLDKDSASGSFKVPSDFDVQSKLAELAKTAGKMKDFSIEK